MGDSDGSRRFIFDAVSALILFVVALGGAYLPKYLDARGRSSGNSRSFAFQLGNMLSAGVMLSACFCHLLAEALKETLKALPKFPLAPFLCALGCLLTLAADQYATKMSGHHHAHHNSANLLKANHEPSDRQSLHTNGSPMQSWTQLTVADALGDPEEAVGAERPVEPAEPAEPQTFEIEGHGSGGTSGAKVSFLTALFLGLALSLHSVLEGMALGAQQTIDASEHVLIAIAAHKGLAAYALGASLIDSKTTVSRFWKVAGGFSIASPIGILLGYGLSEVSNSLGAASMSALASGTFLYVALMEVVPGELENGEYITSKLIVMFLGFGAMSLLARWA